MAFGENRDDQQKLFPDIRKFLDKLIKDPKKKSQVLSYDFYINSQSLKMIKGPLSFFIARLMRGMREFYGFNRMVFLVRDNYGNFVVSHSIHADKGDGVITEDFYKIDDLYSFSNLKEVHDSGFYHHEESLDPKRLSHIFPVRVSDGSITAMLLAENSEPTNADKKILALDVMEMIGEFVDEHIATKLVLDEGLNLCPDTYAYNRRFISNAEQEYYRNITYLAFLDLDHFKKLNDTYGHDVGDAALRITVNTIKQNIRDADVARWGGEEFIIIFNSVGDIQALRQRLQSINEILSKTQIPGIRYGEREVTFSAGIIKYDIGRTFTENVNDADELHYDAKRNGKFQVVAK